MTSARSLSNVEEISIRQIPKFEFEINNEELKSCIKQLTFNNKTLQKNVQRVKKDVETRATESQITQALVMVNSLIEIDPGITKLLKPKQPKRSELGPNPISTSAGELGKKINQIADSVILIQNSVKSLEKKVTEMDFSLKSTLNEKTTTLQDQLDQTNTKISSEIFAVNEKIELAIPEFGDKLREVETKTLWQINDFKVRLGTCINEQFVKDALKQLQGKINTKLRQESLKKGAIDPSKIQAIESQISKNHKQNSNLITEVNYKIKNMKQNIENTLMTKKQNGEQQVELQKRLGHSNGNMNDMLRRMRQCETEITDNRQKSSNFSIFVNSIQKQIERMNEVLKNMKIGEDFQKMLQKMDPHKICALDETVHDLKLENEKIQKVMDLSRKQIDRLRSKTEFVNVLTPSTQSSKMISKEDINEIVHDYFSSNMIVKKVQNLESQSLEVKAFPEMINELNKKIARLQKETDTHPIVYELRGLQEYVKKEILIVNNRISNLQAHLNDEKRRRPSSPMQKETSQRKLGSSVSFKKLTPVNCISCYQNPMMTPQRKSSYRKY